MFFDFEEYPLQHVTQNPILVHHFKFFRFTKKPESSIGKIYFTRAGAHNYVNHKNAVNPLRRLLWKNVLTSSHRRGNHLHTAHHVPLLRRSNVATSKCLRAGRCNGREIQIFREGSSGGAPSFWAKSFDSLQRQMQFTHDDNANTSLQAF